VNRYALNLKSLALQGQYFSSNEAVTDFGVLVDKVRDLQEMPHIYSMSYDCTRREVPRTNFIHGNVFRRIGSSCDKRGSLCGRDKLQVSSHLMENGPE
jgi:hypothetical protein